MSETAYPGYMDAEKQAAWEEWVASRPPIVQDLARKFPPWSEWVMASNGGMGDYYVPYSFEEDGTLTVTRISGGIFIPVGEVLYNVFGVKPESLIPRGAS